MSHLNLVQERQKEGWLAIDKMSLDGMRPRRHRPDSWGRLRWRDWGGCWRCGRPSRFRDSSGSWALQFAFGLRWLRWRRSLRRALPLPTIRPIRRCTASNILGSLECAPGSLNFRRLLRRCWSLSSPNDYLSICSEYITGTLTSSNSLTSPPRIGTAGPQSAGSVMLVTSVLGHAMIDIFKVEVETDGVVHIAR